MKKLFFVFAFCLASVISIQAAVTIRYYNKDSKEHKMSAKISGSSKTVTFGASKTSSVTIQGSGDTAVIETSCGKITVKSGDSITIENGCIKIN